MPPLRAGSLLVLAALLGGCAAVRPARPARSDDAAPYRVLARVRVAAVGDVLMQSGVKHSALAARQRESDRDFEGYDTLFAPVAADLRAADITFANLETPVLPALHPPPSPLRFHAPPALLAALRHAGVGIVSVANNHVYDQGRAGLQATLEEVSRAGLRAVGAGKTRADAERPVIVEANGVRIAFLAYTEFFNDPLNDPQRPDTVWSNPIDPDGMVEAIERARREADFVVLSLHWGIEYESASRPSDVDLAHRLLDAGADVILGHHPHVLQPIEIYRTGDGRAGLVIYSLGNFISNQGRFYAHRVTPGRVAETRDGVLLRFVAERRDYGAGVVRTELADVRYVPLWTDNDTLDRGGWSPAQIRVVNLARALTSVRAELATLLAARPASGFAPEEAGAYARLKIRLDMLLRRKAAIVDRLGKDYLSEP